MIHLSTSLVSVSATVIVARLCTLRRTAALSGKRTALVILWNNSRNYQSLCLKEPLSSSGSCMSHVGLRGRSASWSSEALTVPHVPHHITRTISRAHNATRDPSSDILVQTEQQNCAGTPLCRSQPELQANPFNPVQYT